MNIFVSYARIDKPFCIQLVEILSAHNPWYDQRLYAGQHWWKEILRRLDWCEGFIYLLSPDSVASEYCRKELAIAQKIGREIFPVLIHPATKLPANLQSLHYVDMSAGRNAENITMLLNSILLAERNLKSKGKSSTIRTMPHAATTPPVTQSAEIIGKAAKAFETGKFDEAVMLLRQAKANNITSHFIDIEALLKEAELALEQQIHRREAARHYAQIYELFQYTTTRKVACDAFRAFQVEYPDYDPKGLKEQCLGTSSSPAAHPSLDRLLKTEILPMLRWCEIPHGIVKLENIGHKSPGINESVIEVDEFLMSKYPVTNAQFDMFLNAPDGYAQSQWWQFSRKAYEWHTNHSQPLDGRFRGDERPRENVNWYEAYAFCLWVSHLTGVTITLPILAQWQRAAQGDDDRFFPWGNVYHEDCCNTRESGLKMTTNVTRYQEGVSPYGVYDMAGNVWEWCLDKTDPDDDSPDFKRAVVGGSYVSPCDRAQASFRYFLNPESRYSSIGMRLVALPLGAQHGEPYYGG